MTTTTTPTVLVDDDQAVRTLTLNRPQKRNAIDIDLRIALAEAIEDAGHNDGVRVIILTGAGPAFCSGGDISTMERMAPKAALARAELAQRVIRAIWTTPKPVIAAVEGSAYGAGAALAAACDRVIAASDATFSMSFTNVGLAGDMGTFVSLPSRVGTARARQLLMLPTPIPATRAHDLGLVDEVVDPGQALASARADAARLAAGPPDALGVIKVFLTGVGARHPLDMLDCEAACQAELFNSDDFAEGVAAFKEKRRPMFGTKKGEQP
jgi:enoyl-CoA hydratase/carnithine racemase